MSRSTLILWDSSSTPHDQNGLVVLWNGYVETNNECSLLRYVDEHGEALRKKYLAWVHELGECQIYDKRVIDHLSFGGDFSYWWMTLFVEKSPWKSRIVLDVVRMFALEEILIQRGIRHVVLVSPDGKLHVAVNNLCQKLGIGYSRKRLAEGRGGAWSLTRLFHALPYSVQALFSLIRFVWMRWPLHRLRQANWTHGDRALFVCAPFFNLVPDRAAQGEFRSRYWEGLHDLLREVNSTPNWLHLYYPHEAIPATNAAIALAERFNRKSQGRECHSFVEAYLSWHLVLRVIKRWLQLVGVSWRLHNLSQQKVEKNPWAVFWPLIRCDWLDSIQGKSAVNNLLWIELFDAAMKDIPPQLQGIYLCENQSWERALIHAWGKHGHGRLIAVAHSTIRFWDTRYFTDIRTLMRDSPNPLPQPSLTALNGKAAINAYSAMEHPEDIVVECEAIRYGYLNKIDARHASNDAAQKEMRILILGDYRPGSTLKMLRLLESAASSFNKEVTFTVKPHPNAPVNPDEFTRMKITVVDSPLQEVLPDYAIAIVSNMTSAAVDAYLSGLTVIVVLDDQDFNYSPLRGMSGVYCVSGADELINAVTEAVHGFVEKPEHNDFFFINPALPRWRALLVSDFGAESGAVTQGNKLS